MRVCSVTQSCPTLCNPMGCSLPGSSVCEILQARILEWVAMPSPPGDLPNPGIEPRFPSLQADSLLSDPPGMPYSLFKSLFITNGNELCKNILLVQNFLHVLSLKFPSVQFSRPVTSDSLTPHGLQQAGLPVHHQLLEFTQTYVH